MEFVDTHCHLSTAPPSTLPDLLEQARSSGITRLIDVGAGEGMMSAAKALAIAEKFPAVWASIGIHPHDAATFDNLRELESLAAHPKVVAIGETGLDFYRDWAPREAQVRLFEHSIAVARALRKPLIIHCRDAVEDTLRILKQDKAAEVGGVFHCYVGNGELAAELRDMNFLVSFTGILTFRKAAEIHEAARVIPLEQIMLETDMPYMAPEPFRGKQSEPKHVLLIAEKLAEIKGLSLEQIASVTTSNALRLFGLS